MAEYIEREALIAEFKRLSLGENSIIERLFADGVYAVIETFQAADVASVRPELRKAVDLLHKNYEKALNSSYVRNPIAWALYHTWKKMDENNRRRCK